MAEINPKMVKWDEPSPAPAIDATQVQWDEPVTATDNRVMPSVADRLRRVAGLGVRAAGPVGAGAAIGATLGSVFPGVGTALGGAAGATAAGLTQAADSALGTDVIGRVMDRLGIPRPETAAERIAVDVTGALPNAAGQIGMIAQAAKPAVALSPTVTESVLGTMAQQPGRQLAATASGVGSASAVREGGGTPSEQRAAQVFGSMIPFAGQMVSGAVRGADKPARDTLLNSREAGYVIPPSQFPGAGPITRKAEGFGGKILTAQEASLKNQELTNTLARRALGMGDDAPLTFKALEEQRNVLSQPYREVSAINTMAAKTLERLKEARAEATSHFKFYDRSADPKALATARAAAQSAERLETRLEAFAKNAGKPELINDLRSARTAIAKTYDIERALNDATGTVDARILGRSFDHGSPLTGELKTIAKFAEAYPNVARTPEAIGSVPGDSPLSWGASAGLGLGGFAASGGSPYGAALAAIPFLRGPVRGALLSEPYQALMTPLANPLSRGDATGLGILQNLYNEPR